MKESLKKIEGFNITVHDFRRTFSTALKELGIADKTPTAKMKSFNEKIIAAPTPFLYRIKDVWKAFAARIQNLIAIFHDWVEDLNKNGKILCGFGAAAKASTLINSSQINQKWIRAGL